MIAELTPVFIKFIPKPLEEGKLYISEEFNTSIHLCACGCGVQTVLPFNRTINGQNDGWTLAKNGDLITMRPSVGNFSGERPYHAHYYITDNKIEWCEPVRPQPRKQ